MQAAKQVTHINLAAIAQLVERGTSTSTMLCRGLRFEVCIALMFLSMESNANSFPVRMVAQTNWFEIFLFCQFFGRSPSFVRSGYSDGGKGNGSNLATFGFLPLQFIRCMNDGGSTYLYLSMVA